MAPQSEARTLYVLVSSLAGTVLSLPPLGSSLRIQCSRWLP